MGSIEESTMSEEKSNLGNLSILTKVDKLRELIGTKIALPQVCFFLLPPEKLDIKMLTFSSS